ncbi:riboflavin kinase, partial [Photobacterium damselae]
YGVGEKPIPGVANIGHRPTVKGVRQQLEVHLFDFHSDLYGRQIEVVLRHKLRDEQKFESFDALKAQIEHDAQSARLWLAEANNVQLRPSNGI